MACRIAQEHIWNHHLQVKLIVHALEFDDVQCKMIQMYNSSCCYMNIFISKGLFECDNSQVISPEWPHLCININKQISVLNWVTAVVCKCTQLS